MNISKIASSKLLSLLVCFRPNVSLEPVIRHILSTFVRSRNNKERRRSEHIRGCAMQWVEMTF